MATVRLKYVWHPTIKGREFCYYRRGGARTRLPLPTEPGFWRAYQATHAEAEARRPPGARRAALALSLAAYVP